VKHDIPLQKAITFLGDQGIPVNQKQVKQLEQYKRLLIVWNRKHNLVSHNDESYLIERHFLASFLYVFFLFNDGLSVKRRLADIGSGGGFPGIIISIFFPDNKITLIESVRKKTLFLKKTSQELDLNTAVVAGRIEAQQKEQYDIITARALAPLHILDKYAKHLLCGGGRLYTLKGADFEKEIQKPLNLQYESREVAQKWLMFSERLNHRKMLILKKEEKKNGI